MPALANQQLYESLKALDIIPLKRLDESLKLAENQKVSLDKVILANSLIDEKDLTRLLADLRKVPFIDLANTSIEAEALESVPQITARRQHLIAFKRDEKGLHLAISNPDNLRAIDFVKRKTGIPVVVYQASLSDITVALSHYPRDLSSAYEDIITRYTVEARSGEKPEPPITRLVDTIIEYAYDDQASDIHLEPTETNLIVRFRLDGILNDVLKLPLDLHSRISSRIKIASGLRTDEHAKAQDGHLEHKTNHETLDLRVSVMPTTHGEKIVLRLLSERSRQYSLSSLGLSETDLLKITDAYNHPHGMILATGPTGSGKTTTLYSIIKLINSRDVNITTIEDPVEYQLEGINQIQVNTKTELTFAKGLRSIVRQDPDVILVGEIRDEETADIAVNAALTGHLMFSTLHTNDAATSVPRLLDLKVEPFLIASTVNLVIAQRLVRRICGACRVSTEVTLPTDQVSPQLLKKYLGSKTKARLYHGKGCPVCHQTGYSGRVGIFEIMEINNRLRDAIVTRQDAGKIKSLAVKQGMMTMLEDGLTKVKSGITSLDEVLKVTRNSE